MPATYRPQESKPAEKEPSHGPAEGFFSPVSLAVKQKTSGAPGRPYFSREDALAYLKGKTLEAISWGGKLDALAGERVFFLQKPEYSSLCSLRVKGLEEAQRLIDFAENGGIPLDNLQDIMAFCSIVEAHVNFSKAALFSQLELLVPNQKRGEKSLIAKKEQSGSEGREYVAEKTGSGEFERQFIAEYFQWKAASAYAGLQATWEAMRSPSEPKFPPEQRAIKAALESALKASVSLSRPRQSGEAESGRELVLRCFESIERLHKACEPSYLRLEIVNTRLFGRMPAKTAQDLQAFSEAGKSVLAAAASFGGPVGAALSRLYFTYQAARMISEGEETAGAIFMAALLAGPASKLQLLAEGGKVAEAARRGLAISGLLAGTAASLDMARGAYATVKDMELFGFTPKCAARLAEYMTFIYAAGRGAREAAKEKPFESTKGRGMIDEKKLTASGILAEGTSDDVAVLMLFYPGKFSSLSKKDVARMFEISEKLKEESPLNSFLMLAKALKESPGAFSKEDIARLIRMSYERIDKEKKEGGLIGDKRPDGISNTFVTESGEMYELRRYRTGEVRIADTRMYDALKEALLKNPKKVRPEHLKELAEAAKRNPDFANLIVMLKSGESGQ